MYLLYKYIILIISLSWKSCLYLFGSSSSRLPHIANTDMLIILCLQLWHLLLKKGWGDVWCNLSKIASAIGHYTDNCSQIPALMFISVAGAYQAAIANGCSFFCRKIPPRNKKLTAVCFNKTQLWKREGVFSQTVNFNLHVQIYEFFKEDDATSCGLLMQTRCHKFIGTLSIPKEVLIHFAVLTKLFSMEN